MTVWAVSAMAYGGAMTVAALARPIRRRAVAATASVAYTLIALGLGTLPRTPSLELFMPALLLVAGYWLSGLFFDDPQPRLEAWLLGVDRSLARAAGLDRSTRRAPRWLREGLELSYAMVSLVIAAGAIAAARDGVATTGFYWDVVLSSGLACYVWLPWLRSRPPRSIERGGGAADAGPVWMRRVNTAILDRASVAANTLPSGHVATALAAALAVTAFNSPLGGVLMAATALITAGAVAGRYHYVVDCAAGASVALVVWSMVG